jgi:glutamine amidotransferase
VITLIDYGAGNVRSVAKALEAVSARVQVTNRAEDVATATQIVLPGVGAFGDCMESLCRNGLVTAIQKSVSDGTPFLGICVGMQVLFAEGEEMGRHQGLGLLPGRVVRFPARVVEAGLKVPHTGWNQLQLQRESPLLHDIPAEAWAYFNHAYYCTPHREHLVATAEHGITVPAAVSHGVLFGVQFHPEKSQDVGLQVLRNFLGLRR